MRLPADIPVGFSSVGRGLVEDRDNESRIPTSLAGVSFVSFDSGFGGGGTTSVYVMAGTESSERLRIERE